MDDDGALVGSPADVGVGRQRHADVEAPAPAGADLGEEALHVGLDLVGHVAGQDGLEVLPGQPVLSFQEEGVGQLQAHPHEVRVVDQHGVEGGDGLVEQRVAAVLVRLDIRLLDRGHAVAEQGVEILGRGGEGEEEDQGCNDAAHDGLTVSDKENPGASRGQRRGRKDGKGNRPSR